jgi:tetraacyldisaccharide 4'-kinase
VLAARIMPAATAANLAGKKVVAFCGIGRPDKFFATVRALGAEIVEEMPYADHYAFSDEEIMFILEVMAKRGAALAVTTEKDRARLSPDAKLMVEAIPITIEFDAPTDVEALLDGVFARKRD